MGVAAGSGPTVVVVVDVAALVGLPAGDAWVVVLVVVDVLLLLVLLLVEPLLSKFCCVAPRERNSQMLGVRCT